MVGMLEMKRLLTGMSILAAVLICGAIWLDQRTPETVPTGSWGLCFREKNKPPTADATETQLGAYDAKYIGDQGQKRVYLTFDCGYENGNTEPILDVLKAHEAPAAFFVVGNYITSAPELVRRMAAEGHTVGNHTWSHPDMSEIADRQTCSEELQKVRDAYYDCVGTEMPLYYRPPQGIYSEGNLSMAKALGYRTVFWSLAYVDWKQDSQPSEEDAIRTLTDRIHPGAVVLLHNTSSTNARVLDRVLTAWEGMGYSFGTLEELFTQ